MKKFDAIIKQEQYYKLTKKEQIMYCQHARYPYIYALRYVIDELNNRFHTDKEEQKNLREQFNLELKSKLVIPKKRKNIQTN